MTMSTDLISSAGAQHLRRVCGEPSSSVVHRNASTRCRRQHQRVVLCMVTNVMQNVRPARFAILLPGTFLTAGLLVDGAADAQSLRFGSRSTVTSGVETIASFAAKASRLCNSCVMDPRRHVGSVVLLAACFAGRAMPSARALLVASLLTEPPCGCLGPSGNDRYRKRSLRPRACWPGCCALGASERGGQDKSRKVRPVGWLGNGSDFKHARHIAKIIRNLSFILARCSSSMILTLWRSR